jgi:hypothetical protein
MSKNSAVFVFITGLLVTFGAVGGVEHSVNDSELLSSLLVAAVGLATMYVGTLALKRAQQ